LLSDMLGPKGRNVDEDEFSDDDGFDEFPIAGVDVKSYLVQFLKDCSARDVNNFSKLTDYLTTEEMLVLKRALSGAP